MGWMLKIQKSDSPRIMIESNSVKLTFLDHAAQEQPLANVSAMQCEVLLLYLMLCSNAARKQVQRHPVLAVRLNPPELMDCLLDQQTVISWAE